MITPTPFLPPYASNPTDLSGCVLWFIMVGVFVILTAVRIERSPRP